VWASTAGAFVTVEQWRAAEVDAELADGDAVTLGFRGGDGWALVACRQDDGVLFALDGGDGGEREAAAAAFQAAVARFRVAGVFCAPAPEWRSLVDGWRGELDRPRPPARGRRAAGASASRRKRVVDVRVDLPGARTAQIVDRFRADVSGGLARHVGDPRLSAPVLAARVALSRGHRYLTADVQRQAPIAGALAAVLAWEARAVTPPPPPPGIPGTLADYRIRPL
jgi:hypothetical protein